MLQRWAPSVAFSPYHKSSQPSCGLTFVCVCVGGSHLCLTTTSFATDISDMHTQTGLQLDLADTQTETQTSCVSEWMLSQTTGHNYTCPCLSDCSGDGALCVDCAVSCRMTMCDSRGVMLRGFGFTCHLWLALCASWAQDFETVAWLGLSGVLHVACGGAGGGYFPPKCIMMLLNNPFLQLIAKHLFLQERFHTLFSSPSSLTKFFHFR